MTTDATLDEKVLRRWLGKRVDATDTIRAAPVALLRATLDLPVTTPSPTDMLGEPLPPAYHWLYFLHGAPLNQLGRDGHAARGGFLPPVKLPRRLWAGGRLTFFAPLRIGDTVRRQSTIKDVVIKTGRAGELCFVTVLHEFFLGDELKMREEHDLVYRGGGADGERDGANGDDAGDHADADATTVVTPTPVMLFRYSALTFNSHRIHYDADYCREAEGLPGVVVHGPLTATLLAGVAAGHGDLTGFTFRARRPLFVGEPITLALKKHGQELKLWAANAAGGIAMTATASL